MAQPLPADPWMVEEEAVRRRLFAAAHGGDRRKALAALGELCRRYRLWLRLVEERWGIDPVHGSPCRVPGCVSGSRVCSESAED